MRIQGSKELNFFTEYGEVSRYKVKEIIGEGNSSIVCSAYDTHTGEMVAIKKINNIFENVSVAISVTREIKLLRRLYHPDIVKIKNILLPPSRKEFNDIYVVFEHMDCDLHQIIKANDDLTPEHHQFFLYQILRGLKYIHTGTYTVLSCLVIIMCIYSDSEKYCFHLICSKCLSQRFKTQKYFSHF